MGEQSSKAAERQFQEAAAAFTRRQYPDALMLLGRAVDGGHAEAQNLLGVMQLNGLGTAHDPRKAALLFEAAAALGLKEAQYNFCNLLFNGLGTGRDEVRAQQNLLASAKAGHRAALRSLGLLYHDVGGSEAAWAELATQCFRLAAEAGDPLAQYLYGLRLLAGHGIAADPTAAQHWFGAAARAGVHLARQRIGDAAVPAALKTPVAPGRELVICPLPELPEPQPVRAVAFMSEYPGALDDYLVAHLINAAAPALTPSHVVDPRTGAAKLSQMRTSYSMNFPPSMYDVAAHLVLRRISRIGGLPVAHGEPLGVLRYGPGQEYQPHYDYYSDDRHHAQRISTVFVYLNDVEEGGGTGFPRLGAKVDPERGKAVKFLNCDAEGKPNPETLHAGLPVIRGEKWLATLWFWDRPFDWFA